MTIINNLEIDDITYIENEMKSAIVNNDVIESKLHVIIVVSNPCQYARRYILAREFIRRFENDENDVILYIVELAYGKQRFHVTDKANPRHLQIHTNTPVLWHKENMINMGVKHLLPKSWKAFAWIDADIEFESTTWALDTLKILNGCRDMVQIFSHCVDMDAHENALQIFSSFGFQYSKRKEYGRYSANNYFHPGYGWAMTRKIYDKMNGIYDLSLLGSGDHNMALSYIGKGRSSVNGMVHENYKKSIEEWENRIKRIRIGYVPGVIRHYFHGTKENRKYSERWKILVDHQYDPYIHVTYRDDGLLIPTAECPQGLLDDILNYFAERNEDEGFIEAKIKNKDNVCKW